MTQRPAPEEQLEVLIVEHDEQLAAIYHLKLRLDGYRVRIARSWEQARRLLEMGVPDLIFIDIGLADGWDVLHRVRRDARTSAVPVIILTEDCEESLRDRGLELGTHEQLLRLWRNESGQAVAGLPNAGLPLSISHLSRLETLSKWHEVAIADGQR
jgi:CheY-like chemotaxis protein